MKKRFLTLAILLAWVLSGSARAGVVELHEGWRLQSSVKIGAGGEALSTAGFDASAWYPVEVPRTVLAALVDNGVYPDPYYGLNLTQIPGYVAGRWLVMPPDSPFYPSWWYRVEFPSPSVPEGGVARLVFDGINYRANVWLNGVKVAGDEEVYGMFRAFRFDVTGLLKPDGPNALAVEIIAPGKLPDKRYATKQVEATTGWDDHNPQPPDLNMGIWEDVKLEITGPVDLADPYVRTKLDLPSLHEAHLTVSVMATNLTDREVTGVLKGAIEAVTFEQQVTLRPREQREITFTPEAFGQLNFPEPRLWWPHPVGPQDLYPLALEFSTGGLVSDRDESHFGVREITTYINDEGWRTYQVNGRKILIRGGAWMTSDMLLRLSERRYEALVRYAREANLNMLRSEGFSIRETEQFYNLCDRYGIMVTQQIFGRSIPDEDLAVSCVKDMMLRIRKHPSLVHFLGHDETFPTPTLDAAYRDLIARYAPDRTYQPHSGAFLVNERFKTGGTRTGTLELWTYAGPAQYYVNKDDGAWGFAQSGGIGGVFASEESIRRMIPADQLWPLWTPAWSLHTVIQGGPYFDKLLKAMNKRYGKPADFHDLVMTGQVMNYECARAMYEAYGRNKYRATGITTWKYDAAWPAALTWQYIDWYLLPTGAYYGAKKACEELHVQYSYDDDTIWVVNSLYRSFEGLKVTARVHDFDMTERWSKTAVVDVGEDGKTLAFKVDWPRGLTSSHFLVLTLDDAQGRRVTDNFYWLSNRREKPGQKFYGVVPLTPSSYSDHSQLRELPPVALELKCATHEGPEGEQVMEAMVKNPSTALAFFVQLAVTKGSGGMEVAPSYWSGNDLALLPGEEKTLSAVFKPSDLEGAAPGLRVGGWNVAPTECAP